MKLQLIIVGLTILGADAYSGPLPRSTCPPGNRNKVNCNDNNPTNFASSPRYNRYKQRQDRVNQEFRELQQELGGNWQGRMGSPEDSFKYVDKETMKKWVEKGFNFASDFNRDFTDTTQERKTNEELLQKSRVWVSRMYGDEENEATTDDDESSSLKQPTSSSPENARDDPKNESSTKKVKEEPLFETPNSENVSSDETFQVAVDLPGVERADVSVTQEDDFLVIEAMRQSGNDGQPKRKYKKRFAFVENEVDMDKIEASLNNGVLVVLAPKKKKSTRKIPII
jgi:HSP20 family molecular chaperone IbpA